MFENEKVKHVKFGEGSVLECDGTHIRIMFSYPNNEKTFAYPTVFDKFVKFENEEAQQQAEHELLQVKQNQKKLEAMKKLIQHENERRRQEAMKAKSKRKR